MPRRRDRAFAEAVFLWTRPPTDAAFDFQLVRRGIRPKALKRRPYPMNDNGKIRLDATHYGGIELSYSPEIGR